MDPGWGSVRSSDVLLHRRHLQLHSHNLDHVPHYLHRRYSPRVQSITLYCHLSLELKFSSENPATIVEDASLTTRPKPYRFRVHGHDDFSCLGLFGGAIYANTFYLASEEIEDRLKEFCLQCIAFWYSIGILSAGLIGTLNILPHP